MKEIEKYKSALKHLKAQPLQEEDSRETRNVYQRDRDRIMYVKAFRRLAGKTQVFVAGHDDYSRTRLTHTLEVAQIAKTISSFLGLDIDLTEAIALGHDIGHAPFGHVGERVINHFSNGCDNYKDSLNRDNSCSLKGFMGFKHNWQSIRVAETLARNKGKFGLNLSEQTLFGILNHTGLENKKCPYFNNEKCTYRKRKNPNYCNSKKLYLDFYITKYNYINDYKNFTIESVVVSIADEIAQIHHDIEDGLRNNIVPEDEIIEKIGEMLGDDLNLRIKSFKGQANTNHNIDDIVSTLSSEIVNYYVKNTIIHLGSYFKEKKYLELIIKTDISKFIDDNKFSEVFKENHSIKDFMYERILSSHIAQVMDGRADYLLRRLFKAFISNPQQLPDNTLLAFARHISDEYKETPKVKISDVLIKNLNIGKLRVELKQIIEENSKIAFNDYEYTKNRAILLRTICDYISGMTDRRAISEYRRLYGIDSDIRDL